MLLPAVGRPCRCCQGVGDGDSDLNGTLRSRRLGPRRPPASRLPFLAPQARVGACELIDDRRQRRRGLGSGSPMVWRERRSRASAAPGVSCSAGVDSGLATSRGAGEAGVLGAASGSRFSRGVMAWSVRRGMSTDASSSAAGESAAISSACISTPANKSGAGSGLAGQALDPDRDGCRGAVIVNAGVLPGPDRILPPFEDALLAILAAPAALGDHGDG